MKIEIQQALSQADNVCDYVPVLSTATNLVDLFLKAVVVPSSPPEPLENRYYAHLQEKSVFRSLVLLLPLIGNVAVAIYDLGKKLFPAQPTSIPKEPETLSLIQQLNRNFSSTNRTSVYNAVRENPSLFPQLFKEIQRDKYLVAALVATGVSVPVDKLIENDPAQWDHPGDVYIMVLIHPQLLQHASERLRGNYDFIKQLLEDETVDCPLLKWATKALQKDPELIALEKEKQEKKYDAFLSSGAEADRETMTKFVDTFPEILSKGSVALRKDHSFMMDLLEINPQVSYYLEPQFWEDEEFVFSFIRRIKETAFARLPPERMGDKQFVMRLIEEFPLLVLREPYIGYFGFISTLSPELQEDPEVRQKLKDLRIYFTYEEAPEDLGPPPLSLQDVSARDDEATVAAAMEEDPSALLHASERLRKNIAFLEKYRLKHPDEKLHMGIGVQTIPYCYAHGTVKDLIVHSRFLEARKEMLRSTDDRELALLEVKEKGFLLQDLPEKFQDDEEIVSAAMQDNLYNLTFASARIRKSHTFLKEYQTKHCPGWFTLYKYAHEDLRKDPPFGLWLVRRAPELLPILDVSLQYDEEILLEALSRDKSNTVMKHIKSTQEGRALLSSRPFVLRLLQRRGDYLGHVAPQFQSDEVVVAHAFKSNTSSLQSADRIARTKPRFMKNVIENSRQHSSSSETDWTYLDPVLKKDVDFALFMMTIDPFSLHYFSPDVQNNEVVKKLQKEMEYLHKNIGEHPDFLDTATEEQQKNPSLVLALFHLNPQVLFHAHLDLQNNDSFVVRLLHEFPDSALKLKKMDRSRLKTLLDEAYSRLEDTGLIWRYWDVYTQLGLEMPAALVAQEPAVIESRKSFETGQEVLRDQQRTGNSPFDLPSTI